MKKFILLFCFQMGLGLLLHAEVSPPDRWERQDQLIIRSISPKEPLPAGQPIELKLTVDATLMSADTASVHLILVDPATKRGRPHMIRDLLRGAQTVELSATVTPELNSARLEVLLIINAKNEQTTFYHRRCQMCRRSRRPPLPFGQKNVFLVSPFRLDRANGYKKLLNFLSMS